ncbi:patatin-like phospholipase family protein [Nocardia sp. NPDC057663]|uniref:patatin-like phospholipase family protein n=1 Tax=Nocardia sp. NPDC057663 TaxID=3346201 RepID=UPI003672E1F6
MIRRGLVIGAGGTVGGAWNVGVLAALQDATGWDPRTADVIVGTSTGSTIAAMLGAGVGVAEMVDAHRGRSSARSSVRDFLGKPPPGLPNVRRPWPLAADALVANLRNPLGAVAALVPEGQHPWPQIDALAADLAVDGWVAHPATWIVAYDIDDARLVTFGRSDSPKATLQQAFRASWGVPGWFPRTVIDGHRFVDGAVASSESADSLIDSDVDEVVVIAPMTGPLLPWRAGGLALAPVHQILTSALDRQCMALAQAGKRVLRVHPTVEDLIHMRVNPMEPARRLVALDCGLRIDAHQSNWSTP